MKKILVSFFVFLCSISVMAEEITGAFGFNLGDKIENVGTSWGTYGNVEVNYVVPIKKSNLFETYIIGRTPITHKIFLIMATTEKDTSKTFDIMEGIITDKYGEMNDNGIEFMEKTRYITNNNQTIVIKTKDGFSETTFSIKYLDNNLLSLAKKELIKLESKKEDLSNF